MAAAGIWIKAIVKYFRFIQDAFSRLLCYFIIYLYVNLSLDFIKP